MLHLNFTHLASASLSRVSQVISILMEDTLLVLKCSSILLNLSTNTTHGSSNHAILAMCLYIVNRAMPTSTGEAARVNASLPTDILMETYFLTGPLNQLTASSHSNASQTATISTGDKTKDQLHSLPTDHPMETHSFSGALSQLIE